MLSGAYKDYLTQNKYCSPIYPSNSELRKNGSPVSKWFKVNVSSKVLMRIRIDSFFFCVQF